MTNSQALLYYRTQDGQQDYQFEFARLAGGWRIYIISQPGYSGHNESSHATHRLRDQRGQYVCWSGSIESLDDAKRVAALWADCTQQYRSTGSWPSGTATPRTSHLTLPQSTHLDLAALRSAMPPMPVQRPWSGGRVASVLALAAILATGGWLLASRGASLGTNGVTYGPFTSLRPGGVVVVRVDTAVKAQSIFPIRGTDTEAYASCQATGQWVNGPNGGSDRWLRLRSPATGYVPAALFTPQDIPLPTC